jgi:hypothetical protein
MKLRYFIILLGLLAMGSCKKDLVVKDAPDFSVSIIDSTTTYKAGKPVNFAIQGGADIISFYSGEVFHDYTSKDGRQVDVAGQGLNLNFNSAVAPGTPAGTQKNQFSILASTNFSGNYGDLASVKAATWTDITSRFKLGTGTAFTPSGKVDISDLLVAGKPIYFALKYINWPQLDSGFAKQWQVESFTLTSNDSLNNAPVVIADQVHTGFRIVDENPVNAPARSTITATRVTLYGPAYKNPADSIYNPNYSRFDPKNPIYDPTSPQYIPNLQVPVYVPYDPNSPYNDPKSENWAVSAPISVGKVDLGRDWAIPVTSGIYLTQPDVFNYTYKKPGTYKAVFVASNNTIDESKQVVKEMTITITP